MVELDEAIELEIAIVELAAAALGILDEAVKSSPLAPAWHFRQINSAVARSLRTEGTHATDDDVAAIIAETPAKRTDPPFQRRLLIGRLQLVRQCFECPDPASLARCDADPATLELNEIAQILALLATRKHDGAIPAAARVSREILAQRDIRPGMLQIALPVWFHLAGITSAPLYGLYDLPEIRPQSDPLPLPEWRISFASNIGRAAHRGRKLLRTLNATWEEWLNRMSPSSNRSRMPQALQIALRSPRMTPTFLAECLGITVAGAQKMLEAMQLYGIVNRQLVPRKPAVYMPIAYSPDTRTAARAIKRPLRQDLDRINAAMDSLSTDVDAILERSVRAVASFAADPRRGR